MNLIKKIKNKTRSQEEQEMTEIREKIAKELKKEFEKGSAALCKPDAK